MIASAKAWNQFREDYAARVRSCVVISDDEWARMVANIPVSDYVQMGARQMVAGDIGLDDDGKVAGPSQC